MFNAALPLALPSGIYPEEPEQRHRAFGAHYGRAPLWKLDALAAGVLQRQTELHGLDGQALEHSARRAADWQGTHLEAERVVDVFAHVREAAKRALGMEHYAQQLATGAALLHGRIVEMETGEGKTLAVTLPAACMALHGVRVHVITVNDYLARRDAEWMRPVYSALGLDVGIVTDAMPLRARQVAYRAAITYCSNKELVFDYLRDRQVLGERRSELQLQFDKMYGKRSRLDRLLLRGLCFGIVDEADSVLIDETRTPLILSQRGHDEQRIEMIEQAVDIARRFAAGADYSVDTEKRRAYLTSAGEQRAADLLLSLGGLWQHRPLREEFISQALTALHVYRRDHDYIVREGRVLIVDEHTGRAMPGRAWGQGLHGFVEAKEACEVQPEPETLARLTYQRFFRRYLHLAGTTGTATEVASELRSVFGLRVTRIEPRLPSRRRRCPGRIVATLDAKWRTVIERVTELNGTGRPILIGTSSIAASETLSALLTEAGLTHRILNAHQDGDEAAIIELAGQRGRITVATNMAGRGTDIRLGAGVAELGGLHVILTERHDAARIDRQLIGRCARQGDPGSYEMILSLQDSVLGMEGLLGRVGSHLAHRPWLRRCFGSTLLRLVQRRLERTHARRRKHLRNMDVRVDRRLAFTGRSD